MITAQANTAAMLNAADAQRRSVFISHASANAELAQEVCRLLEERGIGCWIAPRDIPAASRYGDEIIVGIRACSIVLLLLTPEANISLPVSNEIERAFFYQRPIVPLRIKPVKPSTQLEFFVSTAQWVDAFATPLKRRLDEVARLVVAVENGEPPPRPSPELPTFLGRSERLAEQALRHRVLSTVAAFGILAVLGALTFASTWQTGGQIAAQQLAVDTDPNGLGFVKLSLGVAPMAHGGDINISAAVYLNARGVSFGDIDLRARAEGAGPARLVDLKALVASGARDVQVISFDVPLDTRRIVVCMTAPHPTYKQPYTAIWSYGFGGTGDTPFLARDRDPWLEAGIGKGCT